MLLQDLPTDILSLILEATHPSDFLAFITASPPCFRVYQTRPRQTLLNVLTDAITPGALHYALAVAHLHASNLRPSNRAAKANIARWRNKQPPASPHFSFPRDVRALVGMIRTHARVALFTHDFAEEAARAVSEIGDAVLPPESAPFVKPSWSARLSCAERTRFERAFYRYELYAMLYPVGQTEYGSDTFPGLLECYQPAGADLQPGEYAEMVCVHYYLSRMVMRAHRDLIARLVSAVRKAEGAVIPQGKGCWFREEGMSFLELGNTAGMALYHQYIGYVRSLSRGVRRHEMAYQPVSCFSALNGLGFMARFTSAGLMQRKEILGMNVKRRDFIKEAKEWREENSFLYLFRDDEVAWTERDSAEVGTLGSRAFGRRVYHQEESDICDPMAEMAFPMWDARRFDSNWAARVFRKQADLDYGEEDVSEERRHAVYGPDAAASLAGVQLPRAELVRIWREFRTSDWNSGRYSDCVLWSRADD